MVNKLINSVYIDKSHELLLLLLIWINRCTLRILIFVLLSGMWNIYSEIIYTYVMEKKYIVEGSARFLLVLCIMNIVY